MSKSEQIQIALLGCGKLGQGFYKLWKAKQNYLKNQIGLDISIKYILVKHLNYKRPSEIPKNILVDDVKIILNDPSVSVVIDALGGIEPTYGIIKKFIDRKCHIVSANRSLLASKLKEIFDHARDKEVHLQFDAALGGGIPIIHTLRRDLIGTRILGLWGIASGSSNFILSEMNRSNRSLKEILKMPELKLLSESHMLIDYEGSDSAQKIALLAAMAYGVEVNYLQVYAEGLSNIKPVDFEIAREFGYEIKQLAVIKDRKEGLELRVHPTFIPLNHPLTSVKDEYNAVYIQTDIIGEFMVYGKGAGVYPAANMVLRDLIEIATSIRISSKYMYEFPDWHDKKIIPINNIRSCYYLRFSALDVPGVMGKIATVLGENNINIESAHASAQESKKSEKISYVHIFTEEAQEKDIKHSIKTINDLNVIRGETVLFRILGESADVNH